MHALAEVTVSNVAPGLYKSTKRKLRSSVVSEILFVERCIKLLKPGGVMALVVNDGLLANSKMQYVLDILPMSEARGFTAQFGKYLMDRCQLRAVVSLPVETFVPWGTSVKASVLVLRKKLPGEDVGDYKILMAVAEKIGYDRRGNMNESDPPAILEAWRSGWEEEKCALAV